MTPTPKKKKNLPNTKINSLSSKPSHQAYTTTYCKSMDYFSVISKMISKNKTPALTGVLGVKSRGGKIQNN